MAYSQASIANLALGRIGARGQIVSLNENSPNAVKVLACWDPIFAEVLAERDWKFAKTRVALNLSATAPLYSYRYAWVLPSDLLRFVRPIRRPDNRFRHLFFYCWGPEGTGWYHREDPPFWPMVDYKVEVVGGVRCAITNYGGDLTVGNPPVPVPAMITYIQLITDMTLLQPGFVACLAWRLAAELAISITEDKDKFQLMMQMYKESLNSAEAQNECLDFSVDESGSTSWEDAGRCVWGY